MHGCRTVAGILGASLWLGSWGSTPVSLTFAQALSTAPPLTVTEKVMWDDFYKTLAPDASPTSMKTWAMKNNVTIGTHTASAVTLQYVRAVTNAGTNQPPSGGTYVEKDCKGSCGSSYNTTTVRVTPGARWEEKETCNYKSCSIDRATGNVTCNYTCEKSLKML